jgi:phosphoadenosine phosphosulfate reductase
VEGATPALDDPRHAAFTEEVKLEPFARALRETAPKVWFTALRATDTAVRAQMEPVSINPDGLIKVRCCCTGRPRTCTNTAKARPAQQL